MICSLKSLCNFVTESVPVEKASLDSYVSTETMIANRGGIISSTSLPKGVSVRCYQKGDVLISNIRPYFKKIWRATKSGTCSNDVLIIRSNGVCNPDYLYYVLSSDSFFNYMTATSKGTKMPRGDKDAIMRFELNLPSREIQDKASSVLVSLDDLITTTSKINDYLFKQGQIIFDEFVIKGEYISESKLTDIAHFQNGLPMQKNRPPSGDGLPVLKIKELGQGYCDRSSERCREDIDYSVLINNGDVVFSWSGSLMAKIWCGGKCGLNQHLFKVTSDKYPLWFYYYWLQHHMPDFIDIAANKATTMGHICRNHLDEAIVTHPKQEVMNRVDSILTPLIKKQITLMEESSQLISIRDYLLHKLMSGEIDVSQLDLGE